MSERVSAIYFLSDDVSALFTPDASEVQAGQAVVPRRHECRGQAVTYFVTPLCGGAIVTWLGGFFGAACINTWHNLCLGLKVL